MTGSHHHFLTAEHVRWDNSTRSHGRRSTSTQSQVRRRNGRLSSSSTTRISSSHLGLRLGTATATGRCGEKPSNSTHKFPDSLPMGELSLNSSDADFDWTHKPSSDLLTEEAGRSAHFDAAASAASLPPPKRIRVSVL